MPAISPKLISRRNGIEVRGSNPRIPQDYKFTTGKRPFIDDDEICFPIDHRTTFIRLSGKQFLMHSRDKAVFGGFGPVFWAGRRNNRAFMYAMTNHVTKIFEDGGEGLFLDSLMPARIKQLEDIGWRVRRYGNIYAAKTSWATEELNIYLKIFRKSAELRLRYTPGKKLLQTGHRIIGNYQEFAEERDSWAIAAPGSLLITDCGERIPFKGCWIIQRARHLDLSFLKATN